MDYLRDRRLKEKRAPGTLCKGKHDSRHVTWGMDHKTKKKKEEKNRM